MAGASIWAEAEATFSTTVNSTALVFGTATTSAAVERMRIDSGGNVGIGTTTPGALLDISKSQNAVTIATIQNTNAGASARASLLLTSDGGSFDLYRTSAAYSAAYADSTVFQETGVGDLIFYGAAEIMRMKNGCNVGIWTTAPGTLLQIGDATVNANAKITLGKTSATAEGVLPTIYAGNIFSGGNDLVLETGSSSGGLLVRTGNPLVNRMVVESGGNVGIGTVSPTAVLHLKAGTATASTAPLKFTSGTNLTTAEAGVMEFTTDDFYLTITTSAARKGIVLNDGSNLTSGKIPVASTNGRLIDGQTPLSGTKVYYVADTSGGAVTRKLTFINGILTAEV